MARKFECYLGEKEGILEFEGDYPTDYTSVVIANGTLEKPIDMDKLRNDYKGAEIHSRMLNSFNREDMSTTTKHVAYVKATAKDMKKYKPLEEYNPDFPPSDPIVEIRFQCEESEGYAYVPMKNGNCTFMDLMDMALDEFKENPIKYMRGAYESEDGDCIELSLYDKGGWVNEVMVETGYHDEMKRFITSIRLVEEIKEDTENTEDNK